MYDDSAVSHFKKPEPPPAEPPTYEDLRDALADVMQELHHYKTEHEFTSNLHKFMERANDVLNRESGSRPSAPAPSGEPPQLREAKMLMRALLTYKDKESWMAKIREWLARNSSPTDILRAESSPVDLREAARKWLVELNGPHTAATESEGWWTMDTDTLVEIMAAFAEHMREGK